MTFREFIMHQRGFAWREDIENWRMATIVSAIMNPQRSIQIDPKKVRRAKLVTPAQVLGKERKAPTARTPEDQKRIFDSLVQKTKHWKPRQLERKPSPT